MKGIGGASLEVTSSLSVGVKELMCKVLETFVLDSLEGVESTNRSPGEYIVADCKVLFSFAALLEEPAQVLNNGEHITSLSS